MNFLNMKILLLILIVMPSLTVFPLELNETRLAFVGKVAQDDIVTSISKKYKDFYQAFYEQKNREENDSLLKYKKDWQSSKVRKQKFYNYFGLIEHELNRKNFSSAFITWKKMSSGLKYFTVEQKVIYNLISAEVFFSRKDYARTVLLLNNYAYDDHHIYFNMISVLYMKSLVNLNLRFEAIKYFEKNFHLFETILNWDDYNSLVVEVSSFLIDLHQNEKALFYLKKPLLYFPLYHSGNEAMQLLTRIECSGDTMGEQFHIPQNEALLNEQIFNRIGKNKFAKSFILAMVNIDDKNLLPYQEVDSLSDTQKENLFANLKILVSARQYPLAKMVVDYLFKAKIYTKNFQRDEILSYKGKIYNSLNQPLVSADSYKMLMNEYPNSPFINTVKIKYAISLRFAGEFEKSAQYIIENPLFNNKAKDKYFEFWSYYLNKNFKKAIRILADIQTITSKDDIDYVKSSYWQGKIEPNLKPQNDFSRFSTNYPYPIFARQFISSTTKNEFSSLSSQKVEDTFRSSSSFPTLKGKEQNKFYLLSELEQAHLNSFAKLQIKSFLTQTLNKEDQEKLTYYSYLASDFTTANKLVRSLDNFDVKDLDFSKLSEDKKKLYYVNYPLAYWSHVNRAARLLSLDPFWLLSVMRAESLYDTNAESPVGAVGLMQIMPYTGIKILHYLSKNDVNEKNNKFSIEMLRDPDKSIVFSAWYLKLLLENYNGNYVLATAAYNAGPESINRWIKQTPNFNTAEFFENIPYNETKGYVANILGSMDIYSRIYLERPLVLNFDVNKSLKGLEPEDLF